ncbi:hypothetical protein VME0621_03805 [Vibrio mediterranei]|uniref:hypothetical protein n=1 Tax=Vibrio mediterranei TaxID=689 RepID=UPI0007809D5F|nr:hypothetical protein [Vibrio mediterranei]SBO11669.1 hypothetical protein VME0621_03805 [Vibrio mediterranei]
MSIMSKEEFDAISKELAEPIDFDELVASGALKKSGKSYYLCNQDLLPKHVRRKIKSLEQNKLGIKVTFYK